jgi:hypothetical protein
VTLAFFVVAVSVCSAIFLMLDLDRPFQGVNRIPSTPMRSVLSEMTQEQTAPPRGT